MPQLDRKLGTYLHLARASEMRRQGAVRDKLLVLAGVTATEMGLDDISALCRERILARNARHLVRRWPTLTAALDAPDFQAYLRQLRRRYSPEKSEHILDSLGIELGREREAYFNDYEYAVALLGPSPQMPAAARSDGSNRNQGPADRTAALALEHRPAENARTAARRAWLHEWGPFIAALAVLALLALVAVVGSG